MRVLLVGHALCPGMGSEPGNTWTFASQLAREHEVVLLSHPAYRERVDVHLAANPQPKLTIHWVTVPNWMDPWRPFGGDRGFKLHYFLWQREASGVAQRLCQTQHFDVVHHFSLGTVNAAPLLHRLPAPIIWGPIGGGQVMPWAFRRYFKGTLRSELTRYVTTGSLPMMPSLRRMARASSVVLVTNHETSRIVERGGGRRVELFLDNGLVPGFTEHCSAQRADSDEMTILWGGRCEPRKALPLALEALTRVKSPVRLLVAGEGPLLNVWKQCARELNVANRVEFLGRVPWEQMSRLFDTAHLFLFTSLRDSFGTIVLEAMGRALPILTLNHNGVGCFVPDEASIKVSVESPARTIQELAHAIHVLARDPARRVRMGEASLTYARSETWDQRTQRLVQLYQQVCQDRTSREAVDSDAVSVLPLPEGERGGVRGEV